MRATKSQSNEVTNQALAEIAVLIKDETSGINIAKYYKGEINWMYNKAINELKRIQARPQAPNDGASVLKSEECNNDVSSPNEPPAGGVSATAAAPAPSGTQPPAQINLIHHKDVIYSFADTQAIYSQLKAVPVNPVRQDVLDRSF